MQFGGIKTHNYHRIHQIAGGLFDLQYIGKELMDLCDFFLLRDIQEEKIIVWNGWFWSSISRNRLFAHNHDINLSDVWVSFKIQDMSTNVSVNISSFCTTALRQRPLDSSLSLCPSVILISLNWLFRFL